MPNADLPKFSFTDVLAPPDGWRTDCAILSTYSADLIVIVTALLALAGCDLDDRRGNRVELVKAIEALRGRHGRSSFGSIWAGGTVSEIEKVV